MRRKILIVLAMVILLASFQGCAFFSEQSVKFDVEAHKAILDVANTRIKYISCDIGLIDGLGITSKVSFPIMTAGEARAILNNSGIPLALAEMTEIAKKTIDPATKKPYWIEDDYCKCMVLGLGYRATALGTLEILKLFPQIAPYLGMIGGM